jgi:hypothetical protein
MRSDFWSRTPIVLKVDESKTNFAILGLFGILTELYYRLSSVRSPNMRSDFWSGTPIVLKVDLSETNFAILVLFETLMALYIKFSKTSKTATYDDKYG